jgi:hypothetical protein
MVCIKKKAILRLIVNHLSILKDLLLARELTREKLNSVVLIFKTETPDVLLLCTILQIINTMIVILDTF